MSRAVSTLMQFVTAFALGISGVNAGSSFEIVRQNFCFVIVTHFFVLTLLSAAFLVKYSRLNLTMSLGLFLMTSLEKSFRIWGSSSGTTICSAEKILISRTSAISLCSGLLA